MRCATPTGRTWRTRNPSMLSALVSALVLGQFTATQELDARIDHLRLETQTPGVSVVVSRGDQILYAKGFGYENLKTKEPMKPGSVHELASVSKQFTAAAILLLQQDKKLSIDDKLSKFFPSKNKNWDAITL